MAPLRDLDDRDLDRLLAGREIDDDLEAGDLAGLVDDVRATHLRPVAQDTRARHLAAMTEAARLTPSTEPLPSVRARRNLRSLVPRNRFAATAVAVAATTMTVGLGGAGLAVAGVIDVPGPADAALEKVGVNLDAGKDAEREKAARAAAVQEVIDRTPPSERNCAFGHQVAEAGGKTIPKQAKANCARQLARTQEREEGKAAEREARAADRQETEARDERDSFGSQTSERAKGQRTAKPQERRQFGQDTSTLARERARDRGANAGGSPERQASPAPGRQAPSVQDRRPESPGAPADVSPARPDSAGPPEGVGSGRPGGAGR